MKTPSPFADTGAISRRALLSSGLALGATITLGAIPSFAAIAGPFAPGDIDPNFPIPADKKFSKDWLTSLTARGTPTTYSSTRDELQFIGMPIGGLCCGQVYLGGDGQLWHWDIQNLPQAGEWNSTAGPLYAKPAQQKQPFKQSFKISWSNGGANQTRTLNSAGFKTIEFRGDYPIGHITYRDPQCPLEIALEAFSPFCPLDVKNSSIPAIILNYAIKNTSTEPLNIQLTGELQNPVCKGTGRPGDARLRSQLTPCAGGVALVHDAIEIPVDEKPPARPDIVFEDWEKGTYEGWSVTGTAFGDKPRNLSDIASYQGNLNAQGKWTVNTHQTRNGEDVVKADTHIGTLTSREFTIERNWIRFRIGGGKHPAETCINLLIDGKVARTQTGANSNRMRVEHWNVTEFAGKKAQIQIVDNFTGGWGQIGIDEIVFTDSGRLKNFELPTAPDNGSIVLASPSSEAKGRLVFDASEDSHLNEPAISEIPADASARTLSSLARQAKLAPGESITIPFVIAWHFPIPPRDQLGFLKDIAKLKHHYAATFKDAHAVAEHVLTHLDSLTQTARLWRDTWYDSTLPHWFLDRTFATVSTAATTTCYKFDNGRFYGWEGTYCCAGTCTHVWQYAQGLARVFPELEQSLRENIDFGQEFVPDSGLIHYRGEAAHDLAIDGQCGTIIRAYREHTMMANDRYLKAVYPNVKKAMQLVIGRDTGADGILDGPQYNTLDTTWYGEIAWISSLYLGALRTTAAMAQDAGDQAFATECRRIADSGRDAMTQRLFNGEYFIHKTDPAKAEANSTGTGCHIDQVFGQSMAIQAGIIAESDRVTAREQARAALSSLYKYSFSLDIGPYRTFSEKSVKGGRWYAMPGEGGLLMCTWPKGGSEAATGKSNDAWAAGYFNECMSGFEHQVASHMIAEGLVTEGLAITKMIHDRYHAAKRNPYNEVECSNHYARAMAAYGSFVSACGFAHHGPKGELRFSPTVFDPATPDQFKAPFITAQGWGTYQQQITQNELKASLNLKWGTLSLTKLTLSATGTAHVSLNGNEVPIKTSRATNFRSNNETIIEFTKELHLDPTTRFEVSIK